MKTLKFLAFLCIMLGFAVNTAHSQAVVITEGRNPTYWSQWDDNSWHAYVATDWQIVVTPSGNIMATFTFKLDLRDLLVPEYGVNKFISTGIITDDKGKRYWVTDEAIVTADGMLKLVNHYKPDKKK